mmetsp:Transcript_12889/g.38933  ORF Transcript_12889/g.38933 Transcript_12889/m.38933 type:complete len:605 (-) Transcript_12889:1340-3154(-)
MAIVATCQQSRFHTETLDAATNDIDLKGVNVSVGDIELLNDAHLKLFSGVHYGLVGRNGSGKSTLLRAMGWRLLVGFPDAVRVLYVDQLEDGDAGRPVLQVVLDADVESVRAQHQTEALQAALEAGDAEGIARTVRRFRHEAQEAATTAAAKIATHRSGARGFDARKVLVEAEAQEERTRAALSAAVSEKEAKEAPVAAAAMLEAAFAQLALNDPGEAEGRAAAILAGLGLTPEQQAAPLSRLSGGWRIRVALAQALFLEPDLLLLDEPTNHLDLPAILWLQRYLSSLTGTTLVAVSHDRAFLNAVCDEMIVLRGGGLAYHSGNYDEYVQAVADKHEHTLKLKEGVERKRAHIEKSIEAGVRQAKKSGDDKKLGMVASRKKKLDRLGAEANASGHRFRLQKDMVGYHLSRANAVEVDKGEGRVRLDLPDPEPLRHVGPLVQLEGACFSYAATARARAVPANQVIQDVTLSIEPDSRIAIIGRNGSGKSTLIRLITGETQPTKGTVTRHPAARTAAFSQHAVEELRKGQDGGAKSPLAALQAEYPAASEKELRKHMGAFGTRVPPSFRLDVMTYMLITSNRCNYSGSAHNAVQRRPKVRFSVART